MPRADRSGSNAAHENVRIRSGVWAVVALSMLLLGGMLFTIEREPDVSRLANTGCSEATSLSAEQTLQAAEALIHCEDTAPVVTLPLLEADAANALSTTEPGQEPWQSAGAEEGTRWKDEAMRYAKSLLLTGSAEAFLELHRVIREQADVDVKLLLADIAAQWVPDADVLNISLEVLQNETDQGVLRSVKTMLREQITQESLYAMVRLHEQSQNVEVQARVEGIIRGISNRDAYDTLSELVFDRRFPLSDPLTAAAVEGLSHLDTPAAVNRLLQRLNETTPGEDIQSLFLVLTQVNQPGARRSLELAAQGMKEVTNPIARTAAVYALCNYLDESTLSLWQSLLADENVEVQSAAEHCLSWAGTLALVPSGSASVLIETSTQ